MERRLAAILAADMAGFSRLMGKDEAGTLAAYKRHCKEVIEPKAAQYRGRIIKLTGDGVLMAFDSVVDAVSFGVEFQLALAAENRDLPEDKQFRYRMGVNVGEVIVEGADIYGEGVNLAARLEGFATPGGLCLSGTAFGQLSGKLDLTFEYLGEQQLKNIAQPVAAYGLVLDEKASALETPFVVPKRAGVWRRGPALGLLVGLFALILAAGVAFWWQPWSQPATGPATGAGEPFAYPLPDKPSIAVLPFVNVSGEDEQKHLAQGLTDDLITALSKVSGLFVIGRHSVFALEPSEATVQEVAAKLGVHYVLEGTLRRVGERIRINVTLVDGITGHSLWADRYDYDYSDIFALEDDLVEKVIAKLSISLTEGEKQQLSRIPTANLEAYDFYLRAEQEGFYYSDVDTYRRTLAFYQKAIDLDPDFAEAHAGIARIAVDVWRNDYNFLWSAPVARKIAYNAAGQALTLDPENARAHVVLALVQMVDGRAVEAISSARRAAALQPNQPEVLGNLSLVLVRTGEREAALAELDKALRLDPAPPPAFQVLAGVVLYSAHEYARAMPLLKAAVEALPRAEPAHEYLAAAAAYDDKMARAEEEIAHLMRLFPEANLNYYRTLYNYWRAEDLEHHIEGLRNAGLTEWPFAYGGREEDRLSEAELTAMTGGRTWIGQHQNGTAFMQQFDQAGNVAYRSANTFTTGVARVEGDRLCQRFEGFLLDRVTCGQVFRNSSWSGHETKEQADADFVHVTPQALKYFSLESTD